MKKLKPVTYEIEVNQYQHSLNSFFKDIGANVWHKAWKNLGNRMRAEMNEIKRVFHEKT